MKVAFYFCVSKELPEQPAKYSFEEIRKFDKSLPIKEWLKIRPATDKKSITVAKSLLSAKIFWRNSYSIKSFPN